MLTTYYLPVRLHSPICCEQWLASLPQQFSAVGSFSPKYCSLIGGADQFLAFSLIDWKVVPLGTRTFPLFLKSGQCWNSLSDKTFVSTQQSFRRKLEWHKIATQVHENSNRHDATDYQDSASSTATMEDSPLSIAASVTGILTFIAAIFGFIYVRYRILSNGRQEITSVFESVTASILDTRTLQQTMLQAESEHDLGSGLKRALISELYMIEIEILRLYNDSGVDETMLGLKASSQNNEMARLWQEIRQAVGQAQDDLIPKREGRFSKFNQRWRYIASIWETHSYLFAALGPYDGWSWLLVVTKFVLNLGATPILVRWYMIRKSVLEKVKKRKILRSRLLFYEISNANL